MIALSRFFVLLLLLGLPVPLLRADDADASKEARMRQALQSAYDLLRTAQDQVATLQAAQVESDKEKSALKAQVQSLTDQLKAGQAKSTLDLQAAQTERDQLKVQVALTQRKADDGETRNIALYQLSNEILTRYEKFTLGDSLEAKEPFTGLARTQLENLVQGYQDKIMAQKIGAPPVPVTAPATKTAPADSTTTAAK